MTEKLKSRLRAGTPLMWINTAMGSVSDANVPVSPAQVQEAEQNWRDLAPLLAQCFPELEPTGGVVSSELIEVPRLAQALGYEQGRHFVKADHALPVAGSVKARGGIPAHGVQDYI
ncbi:hypothetical protein [Halocynthiibacter styelae]|uniref:Uncharacterized protein n=1 Tax=Halocynthiibacter styelae TaxID=2761955 RepID=A0A8J7IYD5_9RHOB|nr:hypothetical protein [Paenihalocynthiibacter styelae]MBI1494515.1 hypothetical protein [Paenihalocynthiibacter styelae]